MFHFLQMDKDSGKLIMIAQWNTRFWSDLWLNCLAVYDLTVWLSGDCRTVIFSLHYIFCTPMRSLTKIQLAIKCALYLESMSLPLWIRKKKILKLKWDMQRLLFWYYYYWNIIERYYYYYWTLLLKALSFTVQVLYPTIMLDIIYTSLSDNVSLHEGIIISIVYCVCCFLIIWDNISFNIKFNCIYIHISLSKLIIWCLPNTFLCEK